MQPRQHGERVYADGAPALLVSDVGGRAPGRAAPVLWVGHVGVGDDSVAAPCRHNVRQQDAHRAIGAVCLDGTRAGEGRDGESGALRGDDGEEDAQAELGADSEAVFELERVALT